MKTKIFKGYTEYDTKYILKLEEYANKYNDKFDNDDHEKCDLSEVFMFFDEVQNDKDLSDRAKSYAEYLRGVLLPWHLEDDVKEDDYLEVPELNDIIESKSIRNQIIDQVPMLVNLLDRLEVNEVDLVDFGSELSVTIRDKFKEFKEYYDKSKYKWALLYGFHHYWAIKSNRDKIKKIK